MLLFTCLFRSTRTWQWYFIFYDYDISFFVCYVSDKIVNFSDSIPMPNVSGGLSSLGGPVQEILGGNHPD